MSGKNNKEKRKRIKLDSRDIQIIIAIISAITAILVAIIGIIPPILSSPIFSKYNTATPIITLTPTLVPSFTPTWTVTIDSTQTPFEPTSTFTPAILPTPKVSITVTSTTEIVEIKDDNGVSMMLVPAGNFIMGSENGSSDEKPAKTFSLDAFYIDKYEVTNALYKACVDAHGCVLPVKIASSTQPKYYNDPEYSDYPVIGINWKMAETYCEWRGARLPTEAEWEKAARGTNGLKFPWGNDTPDCSFGNYQSCVGDTQKVGSYEKGKSPYGVYDMAGNVLEWVSSLYREYPYRYDNRENLINGGSRVARGGSLFTYEYSVRTSFRYSFLANAVKSFLGFRCAKSTTP